MKPGAKYIRKGSAAHAALSQLVCADGVCERTSVLAAMRALLKNDQAAEKTYARLVKCGYVETGLVRITDAGRAALVAADERHAKRTPKKEVANG